MSTPISDNNLFRIGILKSNRTHTGDGILFITNQDPVLNLRQYTKLGYQLIIIIFIYVI